MEEGVLRYARHFLQIFWIERTCIYGAKQQQEGLSAKAFLNLENALFFTSLIFFGLASVCLWFF